MFMVAPSGRTNPAISLGMPKSSMATLMVVGSVALLELVENPVIITGSTFRMKSTGLRRAMSQSNSGYTPNRKTR